MIDGAFCIVCMIAVIWEAMYLYDCAQCKWRREDNQELRRKSAFEARLVKPVVL